MSLGRTCSTRPSARTATPSVRPCDEALDDGAGERVDDLRERDGLLRTPRGRARAWRPPPCRCRARGARPCGPSRRRSTSATWSSRRPSGSSRSRRRCGARSGSRTCRRPAGRSRSLSIVLGTWTTRRLPFDAFASCDALKQVSSPPMVMSMPTPRRSSVSRHFARSSGLLVGFAREMPSVEPPRKWMRLVSAMVSGADVRRVALDEPLEAVLDAEHLDAGEARADGRCADDAVDAGGRTAADEDRELLVHQRTAPDSGNQATVGGATSLAKAVRH